MSYYIMYPRTTKLKVSIVTKRPNPKTVKDNYGFAEGPFSTLKSVKWQLNRMDIPNERRPKNLFQIGR